MNNIVSVKLDSRYASTLGVWQYDYGQVLRITGPELPPALFQWRNIWKSEQDRKVLFLYRKFELKRSEVYENGTG